MVRERWAVVGGGGGGYAALLHDRSPLILCGSFSDTQGLMFHTNDRVG